MALKTLEKINESKRAFTALILIGSIAIFLLNCATPLIADDYSYGFIWGQNEKICNLKDLLLSQKNVYRMWQGRLTASTIGQFLLAAGKPAVNIFNSAAYTALTLLLYYHIYLGSPRVNCSVLILLHIALWFFIPVWGQVILWSCGAGNYLYPFVLILVFLVPYTARYTADRQLLMEKKGWFSCLMIFGGVICGMANENTSGAVILFILLLLFSWKRQNRKIPAWAFFGLAGNCAGFLIMLCSPGNALRRQYFSESNNLLVKWGTRFVNTTNILGKYEIVLILLFLIALYAIVIQETKHSEWRLPVFYFIIAIAANYAMVLSPAVSERAMFGLSCFLITAIGQCAVQLNASVFKKYVCLAAALASVIFCFDAVKAGCDILSTYYLVQERGNSIENQISDGKQDVLVDRRITARNSHNAAYLLDDLGTVENPSYVNNAYCLYYGIRSIFTLE